MEAFPSTVAGRAFARVAQVWQGAVNGESWATVDRRFGDVSWPPEELLFLLVACEAERFYEELAPFVRSTDGLVCEQRALFIPPTPGKEEEYAREAVWFGRKGQGKRLRLREARETV
jgi:hypothetical protein